MSAAYKAIGWSPHKRRYDAIIASAILLFIASYFAVSKWAWTGERAISDEVILIRAFGSCALLLLHITLSIGPLARLQPRMLPVLFNRRHLGVATFALALGHALLAIGYYHGFGVINPLRSLLTSNTNYTSLTAFPFEMLGLFALLLLFLLAATSHDFWLKFLTPRVWKSLHMSVYAAYALLVGHVAMGALQDRDGLLALAMMVAGATYLAFIHLAAGLRERKGDRASPVVLDNTDLWIDAGDPATIPMDRARLVCAPGGERIALFRTAEGVSAVTNVCQHQGGPLGEGRVINGCITCPWHGWQYRPGDGCSPPPFTEKIRTYPVRISAGRVQVRAQSLPPGTPTPPARIPDAHLPNAPHPSSEVPDAQP